MMNKIILQNLNHPLTTPPRRQRGVVLIVSLILLMILTLIGVTAMQTSSLEERMAGNALDKHLAFQAAEAALRAAENELDKSIDAVQEFTTGYLGELDYSNDLPTEVWQWENDEIKSSGKDGMPRWAEFDNQDIMEMGVKHPPHYAVELLDVGVTAQTMVTQADAPVPQGDVFRVTAVGWGATENTRIMLQSFYLRR